MILVLLAFMYAGSQYSDNRTQMRILIRALTTGTKYGHTLITSPTFKFLDPLDSWVRIYVSMMILGVHYKYYAADKMSWSRTQQHSDPAGGEMDYIVFGLFWKRKPGPRL